MFNLRNLIESNDFINALILCTFNLYKHNSKSTFLFSYFNFFRTASIPDQPPTPIPYYYTFTCIFYLWSSKVLEGITPCTVTNKGTIGSTSNLVISLVYFQCVVEQSFLRNLVVTLEFESGPC